MNRIPFYAAGLALLGSAPALAQDVLIKAHRLIIAPGTELRDSAFLIRDGKILHVGTEIPQELRASARVIDYGSATVVPGFVNPHTWLGQEADLTERVSAFTPHLRAADAFDPFQDELLAAARRGVTSHAFAPGSRNTFAGLAALVKPGVELGRVVNDDLYLKVALVATARDQERYPTSLMGAADLFRTAIDAAGAPEAGTDPELRIVKECLAGTRRVFVHATTNAELKTALQLCTEFGLRPCLLGANEVDDHLEQVRELGAELVLSPLTFGDKQDRLELPARLEKAGIRFSFFTADPEQLRITAALAVRHGLSRGTALAALTRVPAELCNAADMVGSLRAGCHADFAVFDGDPLDLDAHLLAVHVDGVRIPDEEESR